MPVQPPPPPVLTHNRPTGAGYAPRVLLGHAPRVLLSQASQAPSPLPQVDIAVEVVGNLPLQLKLQDVARLLTRRQRTRSVNRVYPPTILELITLVNRNPARPRNKAWNSIMALNMKYDPVTAMVTVTYCVDHCGFDPRTGALDPKRRMASYSAPEKTVVAKVDKKLGELAKYADR